MIKKTRNKPSDIHTNCNETTTEVSFWYAQVFFTRLPSIAFKFIINLQSTFNQRPFKSETDAENEIQARFNRIIRVNTLTYVILHEVLAALFTVSKFIEVVPIKALPYGGWFPYDYTIPIYYWPTTISQFMATLMSANINMAYDTFFVGMMMKICSQINILKHRLCSRLDDLQKQNSILGQKDLENKFFSDCVEYHIAILRMAENVNSFFSTVIFVQYSLSSIVLCTSGYIISHLEPLTPEFFSCLGYLVIMFYQISLFCVSGHQTMLEFEELNDTIYNSNWTTLTCSAQKHLVVMMVRMQKPFYIKSGNILTLNLESLKSLVKLSYSVYNIL